MGVQLGIALLVALERGSRSRGGASCRARRRVRCSRHMGVDLVAVELRVHDRAREAGSASQRSTKAASKSLPGMRGSVATSSRIAAAPGRPCACGQQRGDVEQVVVFGGLRGAGELRSACRAGEVRERAARRGDGDALDGGDIGGRSSRTLCTRRFPSAAGGPGRRRHIDRASRWRAGGHRGRTACSWLNTAPGPSARTAASHRPSFVSLSMPDGVRRRDVAG